MFTLAPLLDQALSATSSSLRTSKQRVRSNRRDDGRAATCEGCGESFPSYALTQNAFGAVCRRCSKVDK